MSNLSALSSVVNSSDVHSAVQSDDLQQPPKVHLRLVPPAGGYVWNLPVKPSTVLSIGDAAASIVLGRITFWFSNNKEGKTRLRVVDKAGNPWLAKKVKDMAAECGLTYQVTRYAIRRLETSGHIQTKVKHFHGTPMLHFRPVPQEQQEEVATRFHLRLQAKQIRMAHRKTAAAIVRGLETGETPAISSPHLQPTANRICSKLQIRNNSDAPNKDKKNVTSNYVTSNMLHGTVTVPSCMDSACAGAKKKQFFLFVKKRKKTRQEKERRENMPGNMEEMLQQILNRMTVLEEKHGQGGEPPPSPPLSTQPSLVPVGQSSVRPGAPPPPPPRTQGNSNVWDDVESRYLSEDEMIAYRKQRDARTLATHEEAYIKRNHAIFDNRWKRQQEKWFNDPENPLMSPDAVPGGFTAAVEEIMANKKKKDTP